MKILFASFNCYKTISGEYRNLLRMRQAVEQQCGGTVDLFLPFLGTAGFGYLRAVPGYIRGLRARLQDYDRVQIFVPSASFLWMYHLLLRGARRTDRVVFYLDGLPVEDSAGQVLARCRSCRWADRRIYLTRLLLNHPRLASRLRPPYRYLVATEYQRRQLRGAAPERVTVIANDYLFPGPVPAAPRRPERRIAYLGQYLAMKGIDYLPDLFGAIRRRDPSVRAEMAFSPNYNERLPDRDFFDQPLIRSARAAGIEVRREQVDVAGWYATVDILILPYRHLYGTNIIPAVVIEAISHGVYVFTAPHPLLQEYLGDRAGYLTFEADADADRILRTLPAAPALAAAARRHFCAPARLAARGDALRRVYAA